MDSNGINMYFHCRKCMGELPPNTSPADYQKVRVGLHNADTVRVWCERHDVLVGDLKLAKPLNDIRCGCCN